MGGVWGEGVCPCVVVCVCVVWGKRVCLSMWAWAWVSGWVVEGGEVATEVKWHGEERGEGGSHTAMPVRGAQAGLIAFRPLALH